MQAAPKTVLAVLASPPTTSGTRTMDRLAAAVPLVGGSHLVVANLYAHPADDLPALNLSGRAPSGWLDARPALRSAMSKADVLLAGWGLYSLSGAARSHREQQLSWLFSEAETHEHQAWWTVGGEPRHPSRWHQYVSDRHGRTSGGTFSARLSQVLVKTDLAVAFR